MRGSVFRPVMSPALFFERPKTIPEAIVRLIRRVTRLINSAGRAERTRRPPGIHSGRGIQIDLVNRDVVTMLIKHHEGVRCQEVIMDRFGRTAVFEDKRNRRFRCGRM